MTIDFITRTVFAYFKVPLDLSDKTRVHEIVLARQVSMYFSRRITKHSFAVIGSRIGKKDHATVMHAIKAVNDLIDTDKNFRQQIKELEVKLITHPVDNRYRNIIMKAMIGNMARPIKTRFIQTAII